MFPDMVQIPNHHPFKWDFPANKPTSDWGIPMAMETTSWPRRPQWHLFQELHGQQPLQALSAAVDAGIVGHLRKQRCSKWDAMHMDELQDGAPKIAKLPYFSGFMVDITIVNGGYNGF